MSTLWKAVFVLAVVGEVCSEPPGTCSLCPAGTFLTHMCALDADTQCSPCHEGTFSATASHLKQCSTCSECPDRMFIDKPCQITANTVCAPCSSVPSVKSDHFVSSCARANAEGHIVDLDNTMMSDIPGDASTSENHAAHVENVEYDGSNKATDGQANSTNAGNVDSGYNHNEAGNTREATKEMLTNSSVLPDSSITNLEPEGDLGDKIINDSGDRRSDTNKVDTDKDQNITEQETRHSDKAIFMPSPVKDQELDNTTDLAVLSPNGNSSLDEVRLGAVKSNDDEDETSRKRENKDLYNQTVVSHNEQFSESRLSENGATSDNHETSKTDRESGGNQADAPAENEPAPEEADIHKLSNNKTDHHAGNSSEAANNLASEKPNSAEVPNEDQDSGGRKRAAIILGVAVAGMVFFILVFFASRCWKRRRGKFKEMTKVNNYDQESAERHPLSYSDSGSHEDPDAEATNGLHRQGPPLGPSSPRTNPPKEEKPQPSEIQVAPETALTIPLLTVSPAPEDLPESLSDHESLVGDVDKLKYIDESTDDEYVMAILNKIPFSRLSNVVEEPLSTLPSTQET